MISSFNRQIIMSFNRCLFISFIFSIFESNLSELPFKNESVCSNFYEYICSKEKNLFIGSSKNEFLIFTEKYREHIKNIKDSFEINPNIRNEINLFKKNCLEKNRSERTCEKASEAKFLSQHFIINKNKIIIDAKKSHLTLNKIYFDLKNIAIEKIKNSSKYTSEEKDELANRISSSNLKFNTEELSLTQNLENLSEEELSKKMDFLYGSSFVIPSSSNINVSWLLLYLTNKKEPFANQFMTIHILSHEIAHIILEHSSNLQTYNFAMEKIKEFTDTHKRTWEVHLPQEEIESYSMYTAPENISDQIGLELALQYIKNKGYKSYKKFFKAFGQVHCASEAKEKRPFFINRNSERIINLDMHAKSIDRVNFNVSYFNEFTSTFNCSNNLIEKNKYFFD